MKNILCFGSFIIFILIGCSRSCVRSCVKSDSHDISMLRIGTNANFPPFETIDPKGKLIGFDIDLGKALAQKLGLQAKFIESEFDALILALKRNQIDIIISGLSITSSRLKEIHMEPYQGKPLTEMALLFWEHVPKEIHNASDIKNLSDQAGLKVTVQAGHYLETFLRDSHVNLKPLEGPPAQILDIKYKKSWAAVLDVINAKKLLAQHPQLKLVIINLPEENWDLGYGIGIAKNNTDLIQKIHEAIAQLKADGTIDHLEKIWLKNTGNY